ncbi:MAG: UMP kinase [Phycisphaerae bacterium]
MAGEATYKRILLKLSGESFSTAEGLGIEPARIAAAVDEALPVVELGVQLAIVVGGGNFVRARDLTDDPNIRRVSADYMGMLGTVINALGLRDTIEARGHSVRVMSALPLPAICESFNARRAVRHLEAGRVVVFAGGTGSPFFTTDTTAALRAGEIDAELIVKATKVDGVYDCDPMIDPNARMYERLTYQQALQQRLAVMDLAAFSLCRDNRIPIVVCRLDVPGNLARAARGEKVGTIITE